MKLEDKLFEESNGKVTGFKVTKVHPIKGVTMEVSFESKVTSTEDRFPSGTDLGSGTMTLHPDGTVDGRYQGFTMTNEGVQFIWWSHERSKVVDNGKLEGLEILTGFSHTQKWARLNNLIMALEIEHNLFSREFKVTAYEWKKEK
jgi:hypothetical protein